jgi:hypothetical protein
MQNKQFSYQPGGPELWLFTIKPLLLSHGWTLNHPCGFAENLNGGNSVFCNFLQKPCHDSYKMLQSERLTNDS